MSSLRPLASAKAKLLWSPADIRLNPRTLVQPDLRFGLGAAGEVLLLNKAEGKVRMLVPGRGQ